MKGKLEWGGGVLMGRSLVAMEGLTPLLCKSLPFLSSPPPPGPPPPRLRPCK